MLWSGYVGSSEVEEAQHRRLAFKRRVCPALPIQQGGPVLAEYVVAAAAGQARGFERNYLHRYGGSMHTAEEIGHPNRLTDLVPFFGLHPTHLSVMFNLVLDHVHSNFEHLISNLDQPWLEEGQIRRYAHVTGNAGLPISNCWGFIDGTVMPICKPSQNQRSHKNSTTRCTPPLRNHPSYVAYRRCINHPALSDP